ncbi:MAG: Fic/DOC family N-terminal domain-containing protein [Sulfurimonadaceae bacterium]
MNPYIPNELPLDNLDYQRLFAYVGDANAELARYDGLLQGVVNPAVLLSPLTTNEAVLSSKIEGTQATLDEVLEHEAGLNMSAEKTHDIQEVMNYRSALMQAKDFLVDNALSLYLIRQMHHTLMDSVRGEHKTPGSFRTDQNWIGKYGCSIEDASFVPPAPLILQEYLEKWEQYIQGDDIDALVQLAIIHAQFELLHPFKDGNGRIGRLLIPLFLYKKNKLASPMFYLSAYLERHREEYYARLSAISSENDWNGWIEFFLKAITVQAKENALKVQKMTQLYDEMKERIVEATRSQYAIQVLDAIFFQPVFKTTDFVTRTGITKQTALALLKQIREAGDLVVIREGRGRQASILAFPALLTIAEGKEVV